MTHRVFHAAAVAASLLLQVASLKAERPELQMQTGHTAVIETVAYSPDGRLLASTGDDSTVRLWEAATGKELRSLHTLTTQARGLCFSRDGKLLAAGDYAGNIAIWNVQDGTLQQRIKNEVAVRALAFSPDSLRLAGTSERIGKGAQENKLTIWTVAGGEVVRAWSLPNASLAVLFTPDGKSLISGGANDQNIIFIDIEASKVTRVFTGHTKLVSGLALSSDGRTLASSSWDHTVKLWDVAGGVVRQTIEEPSAEFYSVAFSPDDQRVVTVSDKSTGRGKVWRATDGQLLSTLQDFSDLVLSATFSPDNHTIASATRSDGITLHDASDGRKVGVYKGASKGGLNSVLRLSSSTNGRILASARLNGGIEVWDLAASTMRVYGKDVSGGFESVSISGDGRLLAGNTHQEKVLLWDTTTGELRHTFPGMNGGQVLLSHDGRLLLNGLMEGDAAVVKVWDTASGEAARTITDFVDFPTELALSPDGHTLAAATFRFGSQEKDDVRLFRFDDGVLLRKLSGHADSVQALAFSPDGRTLASASADSDVILWNVADGARLRTLTGHRDPNAFRQGVYALVFSPDGKMLASGDHNRKIKLWDTTTGAELHTLLGHTGAVYTLLFSPDGTRLLSGSRDSSIKVWSVPAATELCSMIGSGVSTDDWVVLTPEGLFDGTPPSWRNLEWRFSPALYDTSAVELFFNEFYYPNLLGEIMAGRNVKPPQDIATRDRRQPSVKLTAAPAADGASSVSAVVTIAGAPAGAQDLRLFRNGSLVHVWHGDVLGGKDEAKLTVTVPIVAGENRLTAYAFNRDNVKSSDATTVVTGAESLRRKGTAYVLAIGVNSYANHDFDLKYAVADAQDFSAEWPAQQSRLATYANTKVTLLTDAQATKPAILKVLADLALQAKPEDAVVVYFAGHGTAQASRFYLIPHDLGYDGGRDAIDQAGLQQILTHSISDLELQEAIEKIDAGQLLMVIDACNSGQALESEEKRRGPMNSKGLAQLAYEKGMYILTAAQSYQAAQEASKFGHGFLTFALVEEGEKQSKADDEPTDGQIVVREWFDYATQRVPQMQLALMKEAQSGRGVKVAFVKGDEQIADPAERNLQRPRVFYRRETEAQPLIVARPK